MHILTRVVSAIRAADVLLVGGTSPTVYPAAALPDEFTGKHLVIINGRRRRWIGVPNWSYATPSERSPGGDWIIC